MNLKSKAFMGALALGCAEPKRIPDVIHAARVAAVQAFLAQA